MLSSIVLFPDKQQQLLVERERLIGKKAKGQAEYSLSFNFQVTSLKGAISQPSDRVAYYSCLVSQSRPTLCNPMDSSPPGSSVHGILQARILEWVAIPFSRDLPNPEIEPRFPALQADSLPSEPPGKPKNTGGGNLSLLQWIFPTQELNQGLLHCT